ncbi:exodeoxyribonuclease VII small subunit [Heliophilum fasciatum]|uniref:Exodeoxyribonuclease 7 small subunit n=1 Tax=Heliophilum fasciatum TaxID=35700 RepID=A0A4V2SXQ9_9FIRM|nr:exodeoxyribonuclease VII small subunit [Heliophilum fasciatum]MCW2277339.1 exodeoxyribonuclease VII small subunit [Heliophilum fasciatum]TCP67176.1 exodeoxyribonuclease VII small subunit [Heliophilum fasciatum]
MKKQPVEKDLMTYEAAVTRLEAVVRALEAGDVTLDESLRLFQEGTELVGLCNNRLDAYEAKVQTLLASKEQDVKTPAAPLTASPKAEGTLPKWEIDELPF